MPKLIRVMIVDDHRVVRKGLATFLYAFEDLELVGEAENGEQAVRLCAQVLPDVVLMDLVLSDRIPAVRQGTDCQGRELPKMDGAAATRAIRLQFPQVQVVALTSYKDRDKVQDVLMSGAIGYLLKDVSADELAEAIRAAYAGRITLAPEAAQALIQAACQPEAPRPELTEREAQVLAWMVEGLNNQEIADQLAFSRSTIKKELRSIFKKLEVKNRTEAVAEAARKGLISKA